MLRKLIKAGSLALSFAISAVQLFAQDFCLYTDSIQKVSDTQGNFLGTLDNSDLFGDALTDVGDFNNDGVPDLLVGTHKDDDGGTDRGAVWLLLMNSDATVNTAYKISDTQGSFGGTLDDSDEFGRSVTSMGDINGDGITDFAVGADLDDDGGTDQGAVWILLMDSGGTVDSETKISEISGGFGGTLDASDLFGRSVTAIGDLDNNGFMDLAVGASRDDDGGTDRGAVWILFMDHDTVADEQKISDTDGNFTGILDNDDRFGVKIAGIGDLDNDGVEDIAVSCELDDDGGTNRGAVWILFLNTDGTVSSYTKISDTQGSFGGTLDDNDNFGSSLAFLGDVDGDGVGDLAVGAWNDDDGNTNRGAVWILYLKTDGTVKGETKISDTQGNFPGTLDNDDLFGSSVTSIEDLDGNGINDLAIGARADDDGGTDRGAFYVLFMADSCDTVCIEVDAAQKISDTLGNFTDTLDNNDLFGASVANIGDLNGDGIDDLAVGAEDDNAGANRGAVWILFMNSNGTVNSQVKISSGTGNFSGSLSDGDLFGSAVCGIGDLNNDGVPDIATGAVGDDQGGSNRGAIWILFMNANGTVNSHSQIASGTGGFSGSLANSDNFGKSIALLGDLDNDGVQDLAVGAYRSDVGGTDRGAVWILFMNSNGTVASQAQIASGTGSFTGTLDNSDNFGNNMAALGDLNGDGNEDLAVGANLDDDGGSNRGAVWILYLNSNGSVSSHAKISDTQGSFSGTLDDSDNFGQSLAALGDVDHDGIVDLGVGAWNDDDGGTNRGAVWLLYLTTSGTVASHFKISDTQSNFAGTLVDGDQFGVSLAGYGDFDHDGDPDLVVGERQDDDGGTDRGAIWVVFLSDTCLRDPSGKIGPDNVQLLGENPEVTYFPNPSAGDISFVSTNTYTGPVDLMIYNASGQIVHQQQENSLIAGNQYPIALKKRLEPGIYLTRLSFAGKVFTNRVVVQ